MSYLGLRLALTIVIVVLTGCGGGGGSGSSPTGSVQSSVSSKAASSSSASVSSIPQFNYKSPDIQNTEMTRANTPNRAGISLYFLNYIRATPDSVTSDLEAYQGVPDGTYIDVCDNEEGSASLVITNSGQQIVETYNQCQSDGQVANGSRRIVIEPGSSAHPPVISYSWENLSFFDLAIPQDIDTLSGNLIYSGKTLTESDDDNYFDILFDGTFTNSLSGKFIVKDAHYSLTYDPIDNVPDVKTLLQTDQSFEGQFFVDGDGGFSFSFDSNAHSIHLTGLGNDQGLIDYNAGGPLLAWDQGGDQRVDASLVFPTSTVGDWDILTMVSDTSYQILPNQYYSGPATEGAQLVMGRGNHLTVDVSAVFRSSSALLLSWSLTGSGVGAGDWSQGDAGNFEFTFPDNTEDHGYALTFTATDTKGGKRELHLSIFVGLDTDGDNVPDAIDSDDDNDQVPDNLDAFPLDADESIDTDGDGLGDNSDPDRDGDGIANADDAYPLDKYCHLLNQGDGKQCYLSYTQKQWFMDTKHHLYSEIYIAQDADNQSQNYINSYDYLTGEYQTPVQIPYGSHLISPDRDKIFTSAGQSIWITELANGETRSLLNSDNRLGLVYADEDFVVVERAPTPATVDLLQESYSLDGSAISSLAAYANDHKFPFIHPDIAPYCDFYTTANAQGQLIQSGSSVASQYCSDAFIVKSTSSANSYIANYSNWVDGIYAADNSLLAAIHQPGVRLAIWFGDNLLLMDDTYSVIYLYDSSGNLIVSYNIFANEVYRNIFVDGNRLVLLTQVTGNEALKLRVLDGSLSEVSAQDF